MNLQFEFTQWDVIPSTNINLNYIKVEELKSENFHVTYFLYLNLLLLNLLDKTISCANPLPISEKLF